MSDPATSDPVTRAAGPEHEATVNRELLAQMDEAVTGREHWKILLTSGMGFFTDAYDLFIIGVVATMVTKEWHIASYQKSLLSSLALLTSAVGAVLFGYVPTSWTGGRSTVTRAWCSPCRAPDS